MAGYREANFTSFSEMMSYANEITNNTYAPSILIVLFLIMFVGLKIKFDTKRAFGASSFMTAIFAVLFRMMGVIDDYVAFIFIIAAGIGTVYMLVNRD